jgi:hypothetical protein
MVSGASTMPNAAMGCCPGSKPKPHSIGRKPDLGLINCPVQRRPATTGIDEMSISLLVSTPEGPAFSACGRATWIALLVNLADSTPLFHTGRSVGRGGIEMSMELTTAVAPDEVRQALRNLQPDIPWTHHFTIAGVETITQGAG